MGLKQCCFGDIWDEVTFRGGRCGVEKGSLYPPVLDRKKAINQTRLLLLFIFFLFPQSKLQKTDPQRNRCLSGRVS